MKKKTKIILIVVGLFVALLAIIGGMKTKEADADMKPMSEKEYMIKVAKEHQKEMDEQVRYGDKNHRIKTITYEWDTVKHNPMGGFMMNGYVNGDKKINFQIVFEKKDGKKIECWCSPVSAELGDWKGM